MIVYAKEDEGIEAAQSIRDFSRNAGYSSFPAKRYELSFGRARSASRYF
jgi:hypothetical protein